MINQTSSLEKGDSQFQGRQLRSDFLSGRVLDFQADHASRDVADFWIGRFLECGLGIAGDARDRGFSLAQLQRPMKYVTALKTRKCFTPL